MTPEEIREWLITGSAAVGIISSAMAVVSALRGYRLKLQAETRLAEDAKVEVDVKLLKLFVELMDLAHARGPSSLMSDKLFEVVWPHLQKAGKTNPLDAAIVNMPVGAAVQDAAIAAIATLGAKHSVLRPAAEQALESISSFKPDVAQPFLKSLRGGTVKSDG